MSIYNQYFANAGPEQSLVLFCPENVFYFVHLLYTYHNCEGIHAKLGHVKLKKAHYKNLLSIKYFI